MGPGDERRVTFTQEDHQVSQVAYVFEPEEEQETRSERPLKRRKVSRQARKSKSDVHDSEPLFAPLLNGAEKPEYVRLRQQLFEASWARIDDRMQGILRESNSSTLDQVSAFVAAAETECVDQIPAAFIITGPNIASQDLLFEQLSETLQRSFASQFVRLRSSEALTLKAALRKTIRDATASGSTSDDEELPPKDQESRRYLDYDLEALMVSITPKRCKHVFVAFQDSEGFDSGLISDLTSLFHSWRPVIPFTLLFGIATSVELLQARLLKSACHLMYGAQFDCVQTGTILETVFKGAVAAGDVPLQLGAPLLRNMLDRQHEQIAGIQAFISSLKYAYMCHFYANPLSIFISSGALASKAIQPEHIEALRNLESFREHVERAVELGDDESMLHAKSLIEDDEYLLGKVKENDKNRQWWMGNVLRSILVREAAGEQKRAFSEAYVDAVARGPGLTEQSGLADCIRRMSADELSAFLTHVLAELEELRATAEQGGFSLRSKYSGKNKVMRTTVIAQRVQLSQDSAALRDEDKRLTEIVDETTRVLTRHVDSWRGEAVVFSECWVYDSRWPSREVLVPRPRAVFERSLSRPHDYLGCACCKAGEGEGGGIQATLPATSILYQMYLETGSLINVADLWSAFQGLAGREEQEEAGDEGEKMERERLTQFYRGLAELRALGFVKASKKKADHVAKVKWL
ncbi:origin recognition complex subunit [Hirsutella rhossiliensis]|uniref:Origin recognition complex subunit n=1 Tax=Hirsutella rhossiliensis TaxID=111463 RepID=A0A9P8SCZ5_9HYPO|nr:origin recognition complex subunit [Hirsutella rhossiliensis]KAH0957409.1 origin recognition complex subunit [Hirsutella rhossiliensis]